MTAAPAFAVPISPLRAAYDATHAPLFTPTEDASELPAVHALEQYRDNPLGFFVEKMGVSERSIRWAMNPGYVDPNGVAVHQWDGTPEPLLEILAGLVAWEDVCVESGTGTGKSFLGALIVLWFIACWEEARVFTFAPKEEQLRAYIWMEIGKLWPRFQILFPTAVLTDLRIRMRGPRDMAWGAQGYSVMLRAGQEVSTSAQGMHAEHMLLIYEEAPGIATAVTEAGENTCTSPHNLRLALGNPDHQLDALHLFGHDQFGQQRDGVRCVRVSALDHPNVVTGNASIVPGAVSEKSIRWRARKYNIDGKEGRLYKSRVRGLSPAEAADALITLEWVRAAQKRWADENDKKVLTADGKAKKALGVDVANSEDGDEAAISRWTGAYCREVVSFACPDANRLGYDVVQEMKRDQIADEHVGVDSVGVGVGAVNEAKRLERYVVALGSKANAPDGELITLAGQEVGASEEFNHPRSRWYWRLREDLRQGNVALPPDPELAQDLITPTWTTRGGKIVVESKEDLKDRLPGGRSPNKGDAVVYGNWVRDRSPIVTPLAKRKPALTIAERIKKELEDLDKMEQQSRPSAREKYGSPLRQG